MDRRQQKTRKAIVQAFRKLLTRKRYDRITVQNILDEANVGRSTFYAHFETKDVLLEALCSELFYHFWDNEQCPYVGGMDDLESQLCHALYHLKEERQDLAGILLSDSGELFMTYFKQHLYGIFEQHVSRFQTNVPTDFLLNHLAVSFCEAVRWWLKQEMHTPPERIVQYFTEVAIQFE